MAAVGEKKKRKRTFFFSLSRLLSEEGKKGGRGKFFIAVVSGRHLRVGRSVGLSLAICDNGGGGGGGGRGYEGAKVVGGQLLL